MSLLIPEVEIYKSLCALACTRASSYGYKNYEPFWPQHAYEAIALQCGFDFSLKTVAAQTTLYYVQNKDEINNTMLKGANKQIFWAERYRAEETADNLLMSEFNIKHQSIAKHMYDFFLGEKVAMAGKDVYHTIQKIVWQASDNADANVAEIRNMISQQKLHIGGYNLGYR